MLNRRMITKWEHEETAWRRSEPRC
jgi:hypothetical protein